MPTTAAPAAPTQRDAPWALSSVSADGRTLEVLYESGGCAADDGAATVTESEYAIQVTVRQTVENDPGIVCTQELRLLPLAVPLAAPLRGRDVTGGPPLSVARVTREEVPRVIGMNEQDAREVLERLDLDSEFRYPGFNARSITAQSPAPGTRLRDADTVRLTVGEKPRLAVSIPRGQTTGTVRRDGLQYRYRANAAAGNGLDVQLTCEGINGGGNDPSLLPPGRSDRLTIRNPRLRRELRRSPRIHCTLDVMAFEVGDNLYEEGVKVRTRFTLRR